MTEDASPTTALSVEDDLALQRVLFWLVVVPFTLPMWFSLRRRRPDLAERIRWAAWLNVAQSVLVVLIVAAAWWAFTTLPSMVHGLVGKYMGN